MCDGFYLVQHSMSFLLLLDYIKLNEETKNKKKLNFLLFSRNHTDADPFSIFLGKKEVSFEFPGNFSVRRWRSI